MCRWKDVIRSSIKTFSQIRLDIQFAAVSAVTTQFVVWLNNWVNKDQIKLLAKQDERMLDSQIY